MPLLDFLLQLLQHWLAPETKRPTCRPASGPLKLS
jgi:hypothetical protein